MPQYLYLGVGQPAVFAKLAFLIEESLSEVRCLKQNEVVRIRCTMRAPSSICIAIALALRPTFGNLSRDDSSRSYSVLTWASGGSNPWTSL